MWPFTSRKKTEPEQESRASLEDPSVGLANADAFDAAFNDAAGETVNRETALSVPAVWAAVNVLSSTIASLPLIAYRRAEEDREKLPQSTPIQRIVHTAPNQRWTSYRWRKYMMQSVLLDGRSYTWIDRPSPGTVRALWPLDPQAVTPEWDERQGKIIYKYRPQEGRGQDFDEENIIDIPWMLDFDGVSHVKPLSKLKRAIGLSIALERYGTKFFESGGVPPLKLTGPIRSGGAAQRAAEEVWQRLLRRRNQNVLVLPDGHDLNQIGYNPEQAQMSESRRFQIEEVARVYDVPVVFLQDMTHGTFSNTEQQDLHFTKHTINQWITSIEQELNLKLFGMRSERFVKFSVEGLLRGDFATRMQGNATAIQNSINTPNEVRRRENLPPMDGGNELVLQQNMIPLGRLGDLEVTNDDGTDGTAGS